MVWGWHMKECSCSFYDPNSFGFHLYLMLFLLIFFFSLFVCRYGAKLSYDSRTSVALFRSFSASDYIAAQCLRWGKLIIGKQLYGWIFNTFCCTMEWEISFGMFGNVIDVFKFIVIVQASRNHTSILYQLKTD